jgi:hypothetical protein
MNSLPIVGIGKSLSEDNLLKIKYIAKTELFELAGGNKDIIGFAYQFPTQCESWSIPGHHFKLELFIRKAIKYNSDSTTTQY